ncbi:hypothetical protein KPL74_10980 [Bacillus sp. NP157]|nr:hypothetical protein KPL74_10980 [Bacillus sp. NP157]
MDDQRRRGGAAAGNPCADARDGIARSTAPMGDGRRQPFVSTAAAGSHFHRNTQS